MSTTLKDIAAKLNISVSTISRVVNNKKYVKPETRELVLNAINEMSYTPNLVARSLKVKSTKSIGVVIPDISESFFANVIRGIDDILRVDGYNILLCDTREESQKEEIYLKLLLEKQIDGIILATVGNNNKMLEKVFATGTPMIFIDNLPNLKNSYDSVITDNRKASYIAVEHLIKLGHKDIGIITGKLNETTGYERLSGYKKVLEDSKISINEKLITIGDFKEESGYENMKKLLNENKQMTAVYVASSKMTYGAIKAIKEKKLRIPQDIAFVGFDVHDNSGLISPSITSIIQPEEYIGKAAAELMIRRLQSAEDGFRQKIVLEPLIEINETCGYLNK